MNKKILLGIIVIIMVLSGISVSAQTCPGGEASECKSYCEGNGCETLSCDEDKMCGCDDCSEEPASEEETPPSGPAEDEDKPPVQNCAEGEGYSISTQKCVKLCPDGQKCAANNPSNNLKTSTGIKCTNDISCNDPKLADLGMVSDCESNSCHYYSAPSADAQNQEDGDATGGQDSEQSITPEFSPQQTGQGCTTPTSCTNPPAGCKPTGACQGGHCYYNCPVPDTGNQQEIYEQCPSGGLEGKDYCGTGCGQCYPMLVDGKPTFCTQDADGKIIECWMVDGDTYSQYDPRTGSHSQHNMVNVDGGLCHTDKDGKVISCEVASPYETGGESYDLGGSCVVPSSVSVTSEGFEGTITGCGTTQFCAGESSSFNFGGCPNTQDLSCPSDPSNSEPGMTCTTPDGDTWEYGSAGTNKPINTQVHCDGADCEVCITGSACYGGATPCGAGDCSCSGEGNSFGYCDESGKEIMNTENGIGTSGECNDVGCDTEYAATDYTAEGVTYTYGTDECKNNPTSCDCASTSFSHAGPHTGSTLCGHKTAFIRSDGTKCTSPGEGTCMLRWDGGLPEEIKQKMVTACNEKYTNSPNLLAKCTREAKEADIISCDADIYGEAGKEACEEMVWDAYEGGGFDSVTEVFDNIADGLAKGTAMANSFCGVAASWSGYDSAAEMGADKGGFNMCYWDNPMSRFLESMGEIFSPDAMADSLCRKTAKSKVGGAGYSFDPNNPFAGSMQVEAEVFDYEDAPQPHLLYKIQVYMSAGFLCSVTDDAPEAEWDQEDQNIEDLDGWSGKEHLRFQLVLKNSQHTHTIDWDKEFGEMPTDLVLQCNSSGFQLSGGNMLIRRMMLDGHPVAYDKVCIRFLPATDAPKGDADTWSFDIYNGGNWGGEDGRNPYNLVASVFNELDKGLNDIHTVSMSHLTPTVVGSTNMKVGDFCNKIVGSDLNIDVDAYADYPLDEQTTDEQTGASYGQNADNVGGGIVND